MLRFSDFELDPERAELRGPDGEAIKLRPKTFEMLRLFAANAGRVLSKQELMEAVWPNVHVGEDSLFQCIREIRTALGDDQRQVVRVVSGRGYLFQAEVTEVGVPAVPAARRELRRSQPAPAASGTGRPPKQLESANVVRLRPASQPRACFRRGARHPGRGDRGRDAAPRLIFTRGPATIAVMPIADASNDPLVAADGR